MAALADDVAGAASATQRSLAQCNRHAGYKRAAVRSLGSARVTRAGFGVAPKQSFLLDSLKWTENKFQEKFAIARTRSPAREPCALPQCNSASH